MGIKSVSLKTNSWYNDDSIDINFPDSWTVKTRYMQGHEITPLTEKEIEGTIRTPIGSKPLSEISKGKKSAVIVFSDLTRGDDPKKVLPYILDELHRGGIRDDAISFISGLGAHGTMTRLDWAKKLGEDTVSKYYVFNHNVYDHFEEMGTTSRGTPVEINREYAKADVKVGIGGIIAHAFAGFGGGRSIDFNDVRSFVVFEVGSYFGVVTAIYIAFLGVGVVARDVERKSMDMVLSMPISRRRYLAERTMALPFFANLTEQQVGRVRTVLRAGLEACS